MSEFVYVVLKHDKYRLDVSEVVFVSKTKDGAIDWLQREWPKDSDVEIVEVPFG